jgi:hypothetical protein
MKKMPNKDNINFNKGLPGQARMLLARVGYQSLPSTERPGICGEQRLLNRA